MVRLTMILIAFLFAVNCTYAQSDTILSRYKQYLFANAGAPVNAAGMAASLSSTGQWSDINYRDSSPGKWKPLIHIKRVRDLALAWSNKRSPYYQKKKILQSAESALDHWLQKRYKCPNWWHNEIGVPQQMRDILILLDTALSPAQRKGALEVLAQYRIHDNTTGANLAWSADLGLHYGVLTNNPDLIRECVRLILKEIKITTADGVQPDYSFHQHDKRLQMYQYGEAFLSENIRLAWQLRGTSLAFPTDKLKLLSDFVFEGWQWMARGINTIPGTMDRSASRTNALHSPDIRPLLPYLVDLIPERKPDFILLAAHQNGNGALNGFRYFPYSDIAAYQKPGFSFFVKTLSTRTLATESINSENLKGRLLNSGDAYLIRDGQEYFNLMPAWDWDFLPGTTSFKAADKIKRQSFSGSAGDGQSGFTSMDYRLESKEGSAFITAKKSWFCHSNSVVCLVADLTGVNVDTAYTAMDQSRCRGLVTVNQRGNTIGTGNHIFFPLKWVHHGNFVYVPLGNAVGDVRLQTVKARWTDINTSESDEPLQEKIFMPLLVHTNLQKPQSYGYMATYCKNASSAKTIAAKTRYKIIRNDASCQAVSFPDGTCMFAFFEAASVEYPCGNLAVNIPCLLMLKDGKIYASDPTQVNASVMVQLNHKSFRISLPEHGYTSKGLSYR